MVTLPQDFEMLAADEYCFPDCHCEWCSELRRLQKKAKGQRFDAAQAYEDYARRNYPLRMWRALYRKVRYYHFDLWMHLSAEQQRAYRFHPGVDQQQVVLIADDIMYAYPANEAGMRQALKDIELMTM